MGVNEEHPSGIDQRIVDRMVDRRGWLHRYQVLDPVQTLLVVIDLDTKTVELDPRTRAIFQPINEVAQALRAAGGRVAWVTTPIDAENLGSFRQLLGDDSVRRITDMDDLDALEEASLGDGTGLPVADGLDVQPGDVQAVKRLYSAFAYLQSTLIGKILDDRGRAPTTILFAGTVTNVCVESSVRDAVEVGFEAIVISDAVVGHSFGAHEASLAVIFRNFGDVRPSAEVVDLLMR
jgi:nicotinamidase-related amidase